MDAHGAEQIATVVTDHWTSTTGVLRAFERQTPRSPWVIQGSPVPVVLGRSGMAWGRGLHPPAMENVKREGDGKTPAGIFALGVTFGAAPKLETGLPYEPMRNSHYCVDDIASPAYNELVDKDAVGPAVVGSSTEYMRRDLSPGDGRYEIGAFVKHNPENLRGAGSCIFLHVWYRDKPTSGCTTMAKDKLAALLRWFSDKRKPLLVQLPSADYVRLQEEWGLPPIPPSP